MSAQRLTDAQIAAALRAHLPAHARSDVRLRIAHEVAVTRQARPMPRLLAGLSDADPDARRRLTLLAAAALLALGVIAAAAAGAMLRREQVRLTVDPAADPAGFAAQAYAAHRTPPAMTLVMRMWDEEEGGSEDLHRYAFDGAGSVRHECCDGTIIIQTGSTRGSTSATAGGPVWVVQRALEHLPGHELVAYVSFSPDCRLGWRYVGGETILGRLAHHLACEQEPVDGLVVPDSEVWLDAELGIVLRSVIHAIRMNDEGEPAGTVPSHAEIASISFAPPAPDAFMPPPGLPVLTAEQMACRDDPATCNATGPPAAPLPVTTPVPGPFQLVAPDPAQLVADTLASYSPMPAMRIVIEDRAVSGHITRRYTDASGAYRNEYVSADPDATPVVFIVRPDGTAFDSYPQPDGPTQWVELGDGFNIAANEMTLGLSEGCAEGWAYLGLDRLLGREAWHLGCGREEYWIERERLLVLRHQRNPDALGLTTETMTVVEVAFGPQPPELFEVPEGDVIIQR